VLSLRRPCLLVTCCTAALLALSGDASAQCPPPVPGPDQDGDGHASIADGGADCDDLDCTRYPGAPEVCDLDGHDEDCDPTTVGSTDADQDGYIPTYCCNGDHCPGRDCDDFDASVHPHTAEVCNGVDDNCDGDVDEGLPVVFYADSDGDGYGSAAAPVSACGIAPGLSALATDCDDADPVVVPMAMFCDGSRDGVVVCGADGSYYETTCAVRQQCVEQPTGVGICVPRTLRLGLPF